MQNPKIAYVLDFDGTVTNKDISTYLSRHFGGDDCIVLEDAYGRREFGIKHWVKEAAKFLPADRDLLLSIALDRAVVRPGFREFLDFTRSKARPVYIASDGFGFYIEPILEKFGCLPYIARIYKNNVVPAPNGKMTAVTPHASDQCDTCGNCKALHVVKLREEGRQVIYAGDGTNDRFGASRADMVFARDRLAEVCADEAIPYIPWGDFHDLITDTVPAGSGSSPKPLCNPRISRGRTF